MTEKYEYAFSYARDASGDRQADTAYWEFFDRESTRRLNDAIRLATQYLDLRWEPGDADFAARGKAALEWAGTFSAQGKALISFYANRRQRVERLRDLVDLADKLMDDYSRSPHRRAVLTAGVSRRRRQRAGVVFGHNGVELVH